MFSRQEIKDVVISTLAISLIFSSFNIQLLPITTLIVVLVFISHEMSHKFVAQRYGCFAEYRKWNTGILLGLAMALIPGGFVFVAPGAVYITPVVRNKFAFKVAKLTRKEYGKISLSGPLTNISIGIFFFLLSFLYPFSIFNSIARISLFLSLFNLIPFPPLDGFKVFAWDRRVWLVAFALSLLSLFL